MSKYKSIYVAAIIICMFLLFTGCGKKEPEYESLEAELHAIMQDRISNPLVMRMDDTSGTSYLYLDDTLSVLYQPSHKKKTITICNKNKNTNVWSTYGYLMKSSEDKYSAYTPKYAVDADAMRADYVTPFVNFTVKSENEKEKSLQIVVNFAGADETWDVRIDNPSFVSFRRIVVPTDIWMYDKTSGEYPVVLAAVVNEVKAANSTMGSLFEARTEDIINPPKKSLLDQIKDIFKK